MCVQDHIYEHIGYIYAEGTTNRFNELKAQNIKYNSEMASIERCHHVRCYW